VIVEAIIKKEDGKREEKGRIMSVDSVLSLGY
jgi:hypothetical protein